MRLNHGITLLMSNLDNDEKAQSSALSGRSAYFVISVAFIAAFPLRWIMAGQFGAYTPIAAQSPKPNRTFRDGPHSGEHDHLVKDRSVPSKWSRNS
jgi:hypothetical protein